MYSRTIEKGGENEQNTWGGEAEIFWLEEPVGTDSWGTSFSTTGRYYPERRPETEDSLSSWGSGGGISAGRGRTNYNTNA